MQTIQLTQFIIPVKIHVTSDLKSGYVIITQSFFFWDIEFMRLPFSDANKLAELLEEGIINSTATPIVKGSIGEITAKSVRALGTGRVRTRLSVKRSEFIALAVRATFGLKVQFSWAKISAEEAHRFAVALRELSAVSL
ncbi:MAG: hypothetical protein AB8G95_12790 [Anaerolineae bacterium]